MKTVTDVIKVLGRERHESVIELAQKVFDKCKALGITKTQRDTEVTYDVVLRSIRRILSNIKNGKGQWKIWSYRIGHNYLKLYDNPAVDIVAIQDDSLDAFDYKDKPVLKAYIQPNKEGVDITPFYKEFNSLSELKQYKKENDTVSGAYLVIGKQIIAIEYIL